MTRHEDSFLAKIYLKPGEMVVAQEPVLITTVLGSCISVTMFHPMTRVAAICHAMLPRGGGNNESLKYVDNALPYMVRFFNHLRISQDEIQVKLFGGADMFSGARGSVQNPTVGWQNISATTGCLEEFGLVPAASDVGGRKGRKLIFNTDTGVVIIKKMGALDQIPIA